MIAKQILYIFVCLVSMQSFLKPNHAANQYCDKKLCRPGIKHIGCDQNGKFDQSCPKNAEVIKFKDHIELLNAHNFKRSDLAGGKIKGFKPAKRMLLMLWDDELAKLAEYNVRQCKMKHDKCHNTKKFPQSGQNLGIHGFYNKKNKPSNLQIALGRISDWWNEIKKVTMADIDNYQPSRTSKIGHFTLMARDSNNFVGCAMATYTKSNNWTFYLLACNYATNNIVNKPIYISGKAGSGCKRIFRKIGDICVN